MAYSGEDAKERQAASARRHYEKNKQAIKDRATIWNRRQAQINYAIVLEKKDVPCADCKQRFDPVVMDFDHCKGKKNFTIARSYRIYSTKKLLEEIELCEVVCSNCHRLRTHGPRATIK